MGLTAAHCAKTLVIASAVGSPSLKQCARLLLPGMIESVAKIAVQDGEGAEKRVQIVAEMWKAFAALFTASSEENRKLPCLLFSPSLAHAPCRAAPAGRPPAHDDAAHGPGPDAAVGAAHADDRPGARLRDVRPARVQGGDHKAARGAEGDPRDVRAPGAGREEERRERGAQAADLAAVILVHLGGHDIPAGQG